MKAKPSNIIKLDSRKLLDEKVLIGYTLKEAIGWSRQKMRFGRKKKEDKLYQQWARHSELPPEAIPQKEAPQDISVKAGKKKRRPPLLFILLWVGIALLCAGLGLLFTPSC